MKVINCDKGRTYSLNFVDENNVFVGFSDSSQCCETWGYNFIDELGVSVEDTLEDYNFNTNYVNDYGLFELVNKHNGDKVYLNLWCDHNGYYSHGFEFVDGNGKVLESGKI